MEPAPNQEFDRDNRQAQIEYETFLIKCFPVYFYDALQDTVAFSDPTSCFSDESVEATARLGLLFSQPRIMVRLNCVRTTLSVIAEDFTDTFLRKDASEIPTSEVDRKTYLQDAMQLAQRLSDVCFSLTSILQEAAPQLTSTITNLLGYYRLNLVPYTCYEEQDECFKTEGPDPELYIDLSKKSFRLSKTAHAFLLLEDLAGRNTMINIENTTSTELAKRLREIQAPYQVHDLMNGWRTTTLNDLPDLPFDAILRIEDKIKEYTSNTKQTSVMMHPGSPQAYALNLEILTKISPNRPDAFAETADIVANLDWLMECFPQFNAATIALSSDYEYSLVLNQKYQDLRDLSQAESDFASILMGALYAEHASTHLCFGDTMNLYDEALSEVFISKEILDIVSTKCQEQFVELLQSVRIGRLALDYSYFNEENLERDVIQLVSSLLDRVREHYRGGGNKLELAIVPMTKDGTTDTLQLRLSEWSGYLKKMIMYGEYSDKRIFIRPFDSNMIKAAEVLEQRYVGYSPNTNSNTRLSEATEQSAWLQSLDATCATLYRSPISRSIVRNLIVDILLDPHTFVSYEEATDTITIFPHRPSAKQSDRSSRY